jgi:hypothetical protein
MSWGWRRARTRLAAVLALSLALVLLARPAVGSASPPLGSVPTSMAASVAAGLDTALPGIVVTPASVLDARGAAELHPLDGVLAPHSDECSPSTGDAAGQGPTHLRDLGCVAAPTGRSPPARD